MPINPQLFYWDSCVFLSYIDAEPGRVDTIADLFDEIQRSKGAKKIVTSTASIVEVAYGSQEKLKRVLDPAVQQRIDNLWNDTSVLSFIEYHEGIGYMARALMREAISSGYSLKPLDAIHLASAQWLRVAEFYTYDEPLDKYSPLIKCKICRPYVNQPRLPIL